MVLTIAGR